jgi:hypothetical protein
MRALVVVLLVVVLVACGSEPSKLDPPAGSAAPVSRAAPVVPLTSFAPSTVVAKLDLGTLRKYCAETRFARSKIVGTQDEAGLNCLREAVLQPHDRNLDDAGYRTRCTTKLAECLASPKPPDEAPPCSDKKVESWQRCGNLTIGQFDACWRARFERQASLVPADICNQITAAKPNAVLAKVLEHMQPAECDVVRAKCK